jgi:hypothetical protein
MAAGDPDTGKMSCSQMKNGRKCKLSRVATTFSVECDDSATFRETWFGKTKRTHLVRCLVVTNLCIAEQSVAREEL